jgi:hypothetical protein
MGAVGHPANLRPHGGCDCFIVPGTVFGVYEEIYKNTRQTKIASYEQEYKYVEYRHNDSPWPHPWTINVSHTVTGDLSLSSTILDGIFEVGSEHSESKTITDTIGPVELEPGESLWADVIGLFTTIEYSADLYWKDTLTGQEIFIETLTDQIESVEGGYVKTGGVDL